MISISSENCKGHVQTQHKGKLIKSTKTDEEQVDQHRTHIEFQPDAGYFSNCDLSVAQRKIRKLPSRYFGPFELHQKKIQQLTDKISLKIRKFIQYSDISLLKPYKGPLPPQISDISLQGKDSTDILTP